MTRKQLKQLRDKKLASIKDPVAEIRNCVALMEAALQQSNMRARAEKLLTSWKK